MTLITRLKNQRGASAVEFAVVLPLLLILVFGIIEFGMLFYNKQVLTNASREGARAGTTRKDPTEIIEIVTDYCQDRLFTFDPVKPVPNIVLDPATGGGAFQEDLTVSVSYVYDFLMPSLFGVGLETTLNAQTVMKMEAVTSAP